MSAIATRLVSTIRLWSAAGGAVAKRWSSARKPWSLSWPACGPGPCCNGSTPSRKRRTRRVISASAIASPLADALVDSIFVSSFASAQLRNSSAEVARSFQPWL